jgi:hypothetical protein
LTAINPPELAAVPARYCSAAIPPLGDACRDLAIAVGSEAASPLRGDEDVRDNDEDYLCPPTWRRPGKTHEPLPATPASLQHKFFRNQAGTGDTAQFGGKIHAHNPQKIGAEFWSARRKLSHVP